MSFLQVGDDCSCVLFAVICSGYLHGICLIAFNFITVSGHFNDAYA